MRTVTTSPCRGRQAPARCCRRPRRAHGNFACAQDLAHSIEGVAFGHRRRSSRWRRRLRTGDRPSCGIQRRGQADQDARGSNLRRRWLPALAPRRSPTAAHGADRDVEGALSVGVQLPQYCSSAKKSGDGGMGPRPTWRFRRLASLVSPRATASPRPVPIPRAPCGRLDVGRIGRRQADLEAARHRHPVHAQPCTGGPRRPEKSRAKRLRRLSGITGHDTGVRSVYRQFSYARPRQGQTARNVASEDLRPGA